MKQGAKELLHVTDLLFMLYCFLYEASGYNKALNLVHESS